MHTVNRVITVGPSLERHMLIRRLAILSAFVAAVAVMGCGGSSSVNPQSSAAYRAGAHLDTLATQAAQNQQFDRYRMLSYPIAAMMENLSPSNVSVSVDGSSQTYQAVILELVGLSAGTTPTPAESLFVLTTWSDSDADELVLTEFAQPDTIEDAEDLSDTTAITADSTTDLVVSLSGAKKHCHAFTPPVPNAAVSDFLQGSKCAAGAGSAEFAFFFTPTATNPHSTFTMSNQTVNAVRLVLAANNGGQERIRELRRSLARGPIRKSLRGS
jgi:hypothetical protein